MFASASAIALKGEGRAAAWATEDWYQGRGLFGGLQAAWLVRTMETLARGRPLRTFHIHCTAPVVAGPVDLVATREREGATVTHVSGRLLQQGSVAALATATFAHARPVLSVHALPPPPPIVSPLEITTLPRQPGFPAFTRHVEFRFAFGAPLYSGAAEAEVGGWGWFVGGAAPDAAHLVALADMWPPALLATLVRPVPAVTVDWTTNLLVDPAGLDIPPDAPWLWRSFSRQAADGYALEEGQLYAEDGTAVALTRQLVAVLG